MKRVSKTLFHAWANVKLHRASVLRFGAKLN